MNGRGGLLIMRQEGVEKKGGGRQVKVNSQRLRGLEWGKKRLRERKRG